MLWPIYKYCNKVTKKGKKELWVFATAHGKGGYDGVEGSVKENNS